MYRRVHHRAIAELLAMMDSGFLQQAKCFFAGGTAIALLLNEYRESLDIDFLCADLQGYRLLREAVFNHGLSALFRVKPEFMRETRSDQYGIRNVLKAAMHDRPVKFEIVFEARMGLSGEYNEALKVPVLSMVDRYATKLLANTDRFLDPAALNRDIIDLAMMIRHWGPIPEDALAKARQAYGVSVDSALRRAVDRILDRKHLTRCLEKLDMPLDFMEDVYSALLEDASR